MNRIADLRTKHNLTQHELAGYLGIAQNTLSQYENEKRTPDTLTIVKIAEKFGVSTNYVLGLPERDEIVDNSAFKGLYSVTKITKEYEINNVNLYLSVGWKLIYIGQESETEYSGTMNASICYILGWCGDPNNALFPAVTDSEQRNINYL